MVSPAQATREIRRSGTLTPKGPTRLSVVTWLRTTLPGIARRATTTLPKPRSNSTVPVSVGASGADGGNRTRPTLVLHVTRRHTAVLSFMLCVALPTVATFAYLTLIAAPQYQSEARFVVRGNLETVAGNGPGMGGVPQVGNSQEAWVVANFLRSRSMVDRMEQEMDLRRIFGRAQSDPIFGFSPSASDEDLVAYWNRQVKVDLDNMSGVIRIRVSAFSPESAALIGAAIVREAEHVTNDLTLRNRGDRVLQAETEERMAYTDLSLARSEIQGFRDTNETLDPTRTAAEAYVIISKLRDQRSSLNTDLMTARARMNADSPVVRALTERLSAIDEKIKALDTQLLGGSKNDSGTSVSIAAGAEITVRRKLAEQRLKQAEAELFDSRAEQARKQVYVLTFLSPTLPMEKAFPRPFLYSGAAFGVLLACWSVVTLYVGSIYARTR